MDQRSPGPASFLRALILAAVLTLTAAGLVSGGVVSSYQVNGKTVQEGATFAEFRAIAGEPHAIEPVDGNERYVEWVYQCDGAGAGRCKVVTEGGKGEMRARFSLGRLKLIRFERL